ncbi:MAG: GGDEF domain-containing protein [Clostridiales bacterium]|nr:GGDEF domain-containing protein [Candidatus Crickella merdequi]
MNPSINLTEIIIANAMGIMLAATMLMSNTQTFHANSIGHKYIREMMVIALVSCILDPLVFLSDGREGLFFYLVIYIGNLLLFVANLLIGPLWVNYTAGYMRGGLSFRHRRTMATVCVVGVVMLVVNLFKPFVFAVDGNNEYHRLWGYYLFIVLELGFIIDGIVAYVQSKRKLGVLRFFPVWVFLVPLAIGITVQSVIYGVSLIWPCVVISITVILNGINTELSYRDKLTGLYNKYYLDLIKDMATRSLKNESGRITAIMADMNSLKSINDRYGHQEGDFALRKLARIINRTVADAGSVVRIAGDEFVIVLNTQDEKEVAEMISAIRQALADWNTNHDKEYTLSVSLGYGFFNLREVTVEEIMQQIDSKMYEEKRRFYKENPALDRRTLY